MDLNKYQEQALRTVNPEADLLVMSSLGLSGEVGEYNELVKKELFHQKPADQEKSVAELGDILWYLAVAASARGVSLSEVAEYNIAKLRARHPDRWGTEY